MAMTRDSQSALLVALPRDTAQDRAVLLTRFRAAGAAVAAKASVAHSTLWDDVELAVEAVAKARVAKTRRERLLLLDTVHEHLAAHLIGTTVDLERGPLIQLGRWLLPEYAWPPRLTVTPRSFQAAVALATLELIANVHSSGKCPFCGRWWTSPEKRRRTICERDDCRLAYQAEWKRQHPEDPEKVRMRVQRFRQRRRRQMRGGGTAR